MWWWGVHVTMFHVVSHACLFLPQFSYPPLFLEILKPRSDPPNEVIGYYFIYWCRNACQDSLWLGSTLLTRTQPPTSRVHLETWVKLQKATFLHVSEAPLPLDDHQLIDSINRQYWAQHCSTTLACDLVDMNSRKPHRHSPHRHSFFFWRSCFRTTVAMIIQQWRMPKTLPSNHIACQIEVITMTHKQSQIIITIKISLSLDSYQAFSLVYWRWVHFFPQWNMNHARPSSW